MADIDKIKWLLDHYSATDIANNTGISRQTVSKVKNHRHYIVSLSFANAIKLTELACEFREMIGLDRRW